MTIFEKWARVPSRQPFLFYLGAAAVIVLMTVGIYKGSTSYGYLDWDDNTLVEQNPYVIYPPYWGHTLDLFVPGRTPGPHLPLRTATYIFDRQVLGQGATPQQLPNYHHLTNVVLYALDGLLLLWMLRKLLSPWAAVIATLIWVAHPLHVEGVCWVSGRKEMMAAGFTFGALLAYMYGTEALGKAAGSLKALYASLLFTGLATALSAFALLHPPGFTNLGGVQGLVSLALLIIACVSYGLVSGGEKPIRAGLLLALAVFCALCGALSKPVAICIGPILFFWELGYRPRRTAVAKKPVPAGEAQPAAIVSPMDRILAWTKENVFDVDEAIGVTSRLIPQLAIAAWGAYMTVGRAGQTQVLKEATWNAAAKNQTEASFWALWYDIYHLVAPLDLSSLYDVKSDRWYWQAYAGIAILIAIPILAVWLLRKSPKSLLWLAFWLVPLIPVSGYWRLASAHADRYLFIPVVALAVGLGILLSTAAFGTEDEEAVAWERWMAAGLVVAIVGGFSLLSFNRTKFWAKDEYLWGDAVAKNPDLPSARNNYGAALMNAGKPDQALEQYYAAYKILPSLDVAQFNIAATEMRRGHCDVAEKYAEEFSQQHQEMPTGWILLGQVRSCMARSQPNQAAMVEKMKTAADAYQHGCDIAVDADSILQIQDKASACNQAAGTRALAGDDDGAMADWDKCMHVPGVGASAIHNCVMGQAQYYLGKKLMDPALEKLHGIESSGDPQVFRMLAEVYYDKGDLQRAGEYMEMVVRNERPGTPQQIQQHDFQLYKLIQQKLADAKNPLKALPAPSASATPKVNPTTARAIPTPTSPTTAKVP